MSDIELPTSPRKPTEENPKTMFIYGTPKIGKTTILAGLKDNLILDIEGGSEYVEAMVMDVKNLAHLAEIGKALKERELKYKYVTVDTVTKLEEWCHDIALAKFKASKLGKDSKARNLAELEYGLGYGLWRTEFRKWIDSFKGIADYVIFVGHVKDKVISKEGSEVTLKDINLTGQLKAIMSSEVDAVGYFYLDPTDHSKRKITFLTSDEITCGNRVPRLEGQEFVISEKLENGTIKTNWNQIYK